MEDSNISEMVLCQRFFKTIKKETFSGKFLEAWDLLKVSTYKQLFFKSFIFILKKLYTKGQRLLFIITLFIIHLSKKFPKQLLGTFRV